MRVTHPLLAAILLGLAGCDSDSKGDWESTEACVWVPDDGVCPSASDVDQDAMFHSAYCDIEVRSVDGAGTLTVVDSTDTDDLEGCCYPVTARNLEPDCIVGRPFVDDCDAIVAPVVDGHGWSGPLDGAPDVERARIWLDMARGEHASIAAFARLTLQLMALGAPADLLADVQQAALDEVEHAEIAFSLASRFAGRPLRPGAFPLGDTLNLQADPADLAEAAVREGCLAETVGAFLAREAASQATLDVERAALVRITEDETQHAALSWRLVAWLLEIGGEAVRDRVEAAFAEPFGVSDPFGTADELLCRRVHRDVIQPAYRALMARSVAA